MKRAFIIAIILILVLTTGAWFFSSKDQSSVKLNEIDFAGNISSGEEIVEEIREIPKGMREYKNTNYNFSLFYPEELEVKEYAEGEGVATIVFQSVQEAKGFQIFVLPYTEPKISEERFIKDAPSGVRKNLTEIVIDTATAAKFYSLNPLLGETSEIWFIHGGFLYEVTTLKVMDDWLLEIMKSWRFVK